MVSIGFCQDTNGAKIHDTRNEGCVVEMLGKKKPLACIRMFIITDCMVYCQRC